MRRILMIITAMVSLLAHGTDYDVLKLKADRFFDQKEWVSSSAMYELMLDQRPTVASTYGKAIVSAAMRGDTVGELALMKKAIANYVPFDSVFSQVKTVSFSQGQGALYEDFLLRVQRTEPWLARGIDYHLMNYYIFRRDGAKMVEYSEEMLRGLPNDSKFLSILAEGQMLIGDTEKAMATYNQILLLYPSDYDALLKVSNYNYMRLENDPTNEGLRQLVINQLQQALSLKSTPYVESLLSKLVKKNKTIN